jgi:hypothetical protein
MKKKALSNIKTEVLDNKKLFIHEACVDRFARNFSILKNILKKKLYTQIFISNNFRKNSRIAFLKRGKIVFHHKCFVETCWCRNDDVHLTHEESFELLKSMEECIKLLQ